MSIRADSPLGQLDFVRSRFKTAGDLFLLGRGMHLLQRREDGGGTEQEISGEFARHFDAVLRRDGVLGEAEVDAEYYYDGDEAKMMSAMEQYADVIESARRRLRYNGKVGIRPDIIVHRRGREGPNHLVIEVKKRSNGSVAQERFDLLKLRMLTSPGQKYRYGLGLQVRACDSRDPAARRLELVSVWQNGAQILTAIAPLTAAKCLGVSP